MSSILDSDGVCRYHTLLDSVSMFLPTKGERMSAIHLLRREDIDALLREITPEPPRDPSDIQREAARVLDYRPIIPAKPGVSKEEYQLVQALQSLGVRPYTTDSVHKYLVRKSDEMNNPLLRRRLGWLVNCLSIMSTAFLIVACYRFLCEYHSGAYWGGAITGFIATILTMAVRDAIVPKPNLQWQTVPLSDYKQPIPENVLTLALRLTETLGYRPEFHVKSLVEEQVVADPFLFVRIPKRRDYYIAVWDEPTFEPTHENLLNPTSDTSS